MQATRKTAPLLGLATLAALGLAITRPAHAQLTVTATGLTVNGITQASNTSAIVHYGDTVVFTYSVKNTSASTLSTLFNGTSGLTLSGTEITDNYTSSGPGGLLAGGVAIATESFTVASGLPFGDYIGSPYVLYSISPLTVANAPTADLTVVTPEPPSVAAFAFTGFGALGLILKARKRRAA